MTTRDVDREDVPDGDERIFRQTFMESDGNVTYGPSEVIDACPFERPGIGSWVELEDGWYRLRRA